jgi:hypothetical protein
MKKAKFLATCKEYDKVLEEDGFIIKCKEPFVKFNQADDLNHLRWMLNTIPNIINDPIKLERVNRWIEFIQGVLWREGYYITLLKR